jgi:ribosome-binding protein aMBF1 (putative translation factor)
MISICQIRAARSLLGWSANALSKESGVGVATIRRYEIQEGLPQGNFQKVIKIKNALESQGIEFTGDPLKNPGVILHLDKQQSHD